MAHIDIPQVVVQASTPSDHGMRLIGAILQDTAGRKACVTGVGLVAIAASNVVLKDPIVGEPVGKFLRDLATTTKSIGSVVDQLAAT